jgi:hypothetical protein
MNKTIAIIITVLCLILALVHWGDPAGYGWICATAGWFQFCTKE